MNANKNNKRSQNKGNRGGNGNRNNRGRNGNDSKCRGKNNRYGELDSNNEANSYRKGNTSDRNDPSWYARNPQLLKDAASLAFSNPLGSTDQGYHTGSGNPYVKYSFPGVCVLNFISTPGISRDNSSPVNVAARNMYSWIRHANSGASNYNSPDLMMYILAMDSCYTAWAWMTRIYGLLNTYSQSNRYYAKYVIESMCVDFDDFQQHIADFRAYINTFAYKLGSICCPKDLTFITRHVWMASHIWVDSNSRKAQTYMYNPTAFWTFDEIDSDKGGALKPVWLQSNKLTYGQVRDICNSMIAKVIESEDMMIMSGDILKAYGPENLMKLATIDESYFLVPTYSEEVCSQFQNAIPVYNAQQITGPEILLDHGWKISQDPDTNAIIFDPHIDIGRGCEDTTFPKYLMNLREDYPTPESVMVASRLMPALVIEASPDGDSTYGWPLVGKMESCGSDVVTSTVYWWIKVEEAAITGTGSDRIEYQQSSAPFSMWKNNLAVNLDIEKFDWHPRSYFFSIDAQDNTIALGINGDVDNYTYVSNYELTKMHTTALLSQFGAPTMGAFYLDNTK